MSQSESVQNPASIILVVQPDVLVRVAVADYLRECGYRVLEASRADEAMALIDSGARIHIVFSEIDLPGEATGFSLAQWIRDKHAAIRVILAAGSSSMARKAEEACESGPILKKPFSHEELERQIRSLLAK